MSPPAIALGLLLLKSPPEPLLGSRGHIVDAHKHKN